MKFLKRFLGPNIPQNVSIVAAFEGRVDEADENPKGKAVFGDAVPGEFGPVLSQIILSDGSTLADRLAKERIREMDEWIKGEGADPLPRAILRLLANSANRSERLADEKCIVVFWSAGKPPRETWDGPATLAQIIGVPIKLLYRPDPRSGFMLIEFDA